MSRLPVVIRVLFFDLNKLLGYGFDTKYTLEKKGIVLSQDGSYFTFLLLLIPYHSFYTFVVISSPTFSSVVILSYSLSFWATFSGKLCLPFYGISIVIEDSLNNDNIEVLFQFETYLHDRNRYVHLQIIYSLRYLWPKIITFSYKNREYTNVSTCIHDILYRKHPTIPIFI